MASPSTPHAPPVSPEAAPLIDNRWSMKQSLLGTGSFGEVRIAVDVQTNAEVAVKLERQSEEYRTLSNEYLVYRALQSSTPESGFASILYYGLYRSFGQNCQVLVMNRLGQSLESAKSLFPLRKMLLKDVLLAGMQFISRIEFLHNKDFVHRDIKPENFLLGLTDVDKIYLVDFGISKRYRCAHTKAHYANRTSSGFSGSRKYASINTHQRNQPSRRDDLESVLYCLVDMFKGFLPWDTPGESEKLAEHEVGRIKANMTADELLQGMPVQLQSFYRHVRELGYTERPQYSFLRDLLVTALVENGNRNDERFSWV